MTTTPASPAPSSPSSHSPNSSPSSQEMLPQWPELPQELPLEPFGGGVLLADKCDYYIEAYEAALARLRVIRDVCISEIQREVGGSFIARQLARNIIDAIGEIPLPPDIPEGA